MLRTPPSAQTVRARCCCAETGCPCWSLAAARSKRASTGARSGQAGARARGFPNNHSTLYSRHSAAHQPRDRNHESRDCIPVAAPPPASAHRGNGAPKSKSWRRATGASRRRTAEPWAGAPRAPTTAQLQLRLRKPLARPSAWPAECCEAASAGPGERGADCQLAMSANRSGSARHQRPSLPQRVEAPPRREHRVRAAPLHGGSRCRCSRGRRGPPSGVGKRGRQRGQSS